MTWLLILALSSAFDSPHISGGSLQGFNSPDAIYIEEPALPQTYIACGCGCCGGYDSEENAMLPRKCVNQAELQAIMQKDRKTANDEYLCAAVGCSMGIVYETCGDD